ncbi:unnamed protein product [Sphenostylis stenocarpa]|uniref:Uncharacterized protein n=1 Tax=Sphenostylis stenocarpa TaxID=92480 RepID=A0AA86SBQ0_9FABA|nr:unnamed protein product [Sphenostylis stenocarpa]
MNAIVIVLFWGLVSSTCHGSNLQEFCLADLKGPDSPSGYHCMPPETVTAKEFKYNFQLSIPVPLKSTLYPGRVTEVPIVNGLGISTGFIVIENGGLLPMNTHCEEEFFKRDVSNMLIM